MNQGTVLGLCAYLLWGVFPLYFRLLHRIPALELVAHRVIWSLAVLAAVLVMSRRWKSFLQRIRSRQILSFHLVSGLLVGVNWLLYVWGVNAGRVVECSLGYFLNPLLSIALGVIVLGERLRPAQWVGVGLAALGVGFLALRAGSFPWLSVCLALSFGSYGLLKKRAPLGSLDGLFAETMVLALPAAAWIFWSERIPAGPLHQASAAEWALLLGTGLVTTIPLLLFSASARRIPLSLLGFLQYLTPTLQFLIGVFWFGEAFGPERLHGFVLVWAGLGLVALDGLRRALWRPASL